MKKSVFIFLSILTFSTFSFSQNTLYQKKDFIFEGDTLKYRILFPENYDKDKKYPLVIFLHGAGERGNDNEKQLVHGSWLFTNAENRAKYPAIVIFPQCPENGYWAPVKDRANGFSYEPAKEPTKSLLLVKKLINQYSKNEPVDKRRIYILGLSMGGMGTYDMICRYPKTFAAAIPICGGVYTDRLKSVKKLPIRIYYGSADPVVSPQHSKNAYKTLKTFGSHNVEIFEYPGVGHDSWNNAFKEPDFLSWLFAQRRK